MKEKADLETQKSDGSSAPAQGGPPVQSQSTALAANSIQPRRAGPSSAHDQEQDVESHER
jgi:hypothetical protein